MWDNRSAQHAATNDFLPMHRRMERVTVVGDARSERAVSTEEFGPIVSAEWLAAHLDDADLVVVDVRWSLDAGPKRADFERGHIASAVFADLDVDLLPASTDAGRHPLPPLRRSPRDGPPRHQRPHQVVAYDDAGGLIASRLWWMLDALGRSAAVLDGGFAAWEGPTADGPASPAPAVFSLVEWPADCVITKQALAESLDGALTILDARPPDRFAKGSAVDPRPGHVPGARNARRVPTSPRATSAPTPSSPSTTARSGPTATMWWCTAALVSPHAPICSLAARRASPTHGCTSGRGRSGEPTTRCRPKPRPRPRTAGDLRSGDGAHRPRIPADIVRRVALRACGCP